MPRPSHKPRKSEPGAVFVDASGFIAFFSRDDANHRHAAALLAAAIGKRRRLITSNLVLAEVHRLLLFRAGRKAAVAALDAIAKSPSMVVEHAVQAHHRRARAWLDQLDDQVITLTDAVSFAIMESARCRVALTFDHDFWTAGFERFELADR